MDKIYGLGGMRMRTVGLYILNCTLWFMVGFLFGVLMFRYGVFE